LIIPTTIRSKFLDFTKPNTTTFHSITSTNISSIHLKTEDMEIDVVLYKLLITKKKKHHVVENLTKKLIVVTKRKLDVLSK